MIRLEHVTKAYGASVILEDTSFPFPDKGLVCVLGPSGSGKSTLLNLMAGFDSDYQGTIVVGGQDLKKMDADTLCGYRRDHVGFVFQNYHLLNGYTALENVLLATEVQGGDLGGREARARQLLQTLGLSGKEGQRGETLSGGQKQRVAIARALVNDPALLLADEPTGALDRKNAQEIMELLQELARDRLVIVITHDAKCAAYGDQIVTIQEGKLVSQQQVEPQEEAKPLEPRTRGKVPLFHWAMKNFQVRLIRYLAVSLAIALGVLCFVLSLSTGNIMEEEITRFEEKNTAFHNGSIQVQGEQEDLLTRLQADDRLERVYPQYVLSDVSVRIQGQEVRMEEKYPMAKAAETISYGVMPRPGEGEIALSPSLAAKFSKDLQSLLGQIVQVRCGDRSYTLTVSGIFNASYDDFYVSSDVEQDLYTGMSGPAYAISYDVIRFEDIPSVSRSLQEQGVEPRDAAAQVSVFLDTFRNLQRLFFTVSLLVLTVSVLISAILLVKQQNTRFREVGLLSALGFGAGAIRRLLWQEGMLVCAVTAALSGILSDVAMILGRLFGMPLLVSPLQGVVAILLSVLMTLCIYMGASFPLIRTEPAKALRK